MICIHCEYPETKVIYTRCDNSNVNHRRRECLGCGKRYTTMEVIQGKKHEGQERRTDVARNDEHLP
jgi:transcriptional regulator NrdR family protein